VKAKVFLLSIWFAFVPASLSFGQTSPCVGSNKLVCEFPVSGSILSEATFGPGTEAVTQALDAAVPINAAIAAQLTQLPVPSATVGVISIKKKGSDVPVPFNNLGPILTDRPDTVGRGHVFGGFNYQHFSFNDLDGFYLGSLPIAFTYPDPVGTTDPKVHYGSMENNVNFKLDQYVFIATGGVTPTTDVSIVVPINSVSMNVTSFGFAAYDYDIASSSYSLHTTGTATSVTSKGSASGLGDISIGVKQMLLGQQHTRAAAAVGATLRFPTGDAFNYLGSGAYGGSIFGLVEYRARLAPHFKLAYQWNTQSKVLGLANGSSATLPGGLQYAFGSDFSALRTVTLNVDFLGSQFVNTPYLTKNTYAFNPTPSAASGVPPTYNLISTPKNTYTTVNFSGGVKWAPVGHLLLYGNALVQLNNVGLRAVVSPLFGVAYNFNLARGD